MLALQMSNVLVAQRDRQCSFHHTAFVGKLGNETDGRAPSQSSSCQSPSYPILQYTLRDPKPCDPDMKAWSAIDESIALAAQILRRFPHLNRGMVVIAFSGGKDSVALAHVMRELGKDVRLRAVDMGYSDRWESRIRSIANGLRLPIDVINLRRMMGSDLDQQTREDLLRRRSYLDELAVTPRVDVTPCTNCYNCKLVALTRQHQGGANEVLYFGHHADDMISSFIKSSIMYHDRWVEGHTLFERRNYVHLIKRLDDDLRRKASFFVETFLRYLDAGLAATEEPAYEQSRLHGVQYAIARPMLLIHEEMLRSCSIELGIAVESSGCGHTMAAMTRTPREMVQYDLLPGLRRDTIGRENIMRIKSAILASLAPDGSLRIDTRRQRDSLLGPTYKGGRLQEKY